MLQFWKYVHNIKQNIKYLYSTIDNVSGGAGGELPVFSINRSITFLLIQYYFHWLRRYRVSRSLVHPTFSSGLCFDQITAACSESSASCCLLIYVVAAILCICLKWRLKAWALLHIWWTPPALWILKMIQYRSSRTKWLILNHWRSCGENVSSMRFGGHQYSVSGNPPFLNKALAKRIKHFDSIQFWFKYQQLTYLKISCKGLQGCNSHQ